MCGVSGDHTSLIDVGLISIMVPRRVSTNWEMCRSLSLISTGSSSNTVLYRASFIVDAGGGGGS